MYLAFRVYVKSDSFVIDKAKDVAIYRKVYLLASQEVR